MSEKAGVKKLLLSRKLLRFVFATSRKLSSKEIRLCWSRFWYIYFAAFSQTKKGFSHFFTAYVGFPGGDSFRFSDEYWQYNWGGAKDFWNVWWWEKQYYANFSHIVGRLPFVKLHGGTSLSANATRQTEWQLRMIKLFLLVEPCQLGQKQLSLPQHWCVAFEEWSICGQPHLTNVCSPNANRGLANK